MISPRPTGGRPTSGASSAGAGDGPGWPVLARIPNIAESSPELAPLPGDGLDDSLVMHEREDRGLGGGIVPLVDALDAELLELDALQAEAIPTASPRAPRRSLNEPQAPSHRPARMTDQAATPTRRLADQQRRVDRVVASMNQFERPREPAPTPVIAGAAYRMYAAASPHAALAAMLLLVLSAGLLYWIAFGRNSAGDETILFDAPTNWSIESTGSAVAPRSEKPKPPVELSPREVRVAARPEAPTASSPVLPPRVKQSSSTPPEPSATVTAKKPALATPVPATERSTAASPYPQTPYPDFERSLPAYVAEQPASQEPR